MLQILSGKLARISCNKSIYKGHGNLRKWTQHHHHRRSTTNAENTAQQDFHIGKDVYTVASESKHLLVFGVPKIQLQNNIKTKLQQFGKLQSFICITQEMAAKMELEAFTDVFAVTFERLDVARRAKRQLDAKQFFGGTLHITYAPERETIDELRQKLIQRRTEVSYRVNRNLTEMEATDEALTMKKSK